MSLVSQLYIDSLSKSRSFVSLKSTASSTATFDTSLTVHVQLSCMALTLCIAQNDSRLWPKSISACSLARERCSKHEGNRQETLSCVRIMNDKAVSQTVFDSSLLEVYNTVRFVLRTTTHYNICIKDLIVCAAVSTSRYSRMCMWPERHHRRT